MYFQIPSDVESLFNDHECVNLHAEVCNRGPSQVKIYKNFQRKNVNISSGRHRSHTFVAIDHEIISAAILLPSADSFKKGCCQLQAKVCA